MQIIISLISIPLEAETLADSMTETDDLPGLLVRLLDFFPFVADLVFFGTDFVFFNCFSNNGNGLTIGKFPASS
jgi:hypothetical protein